MKLLSFSLTAVKMLFDANDIYTYNKAALKNDELLFIEGLYPGATSILSLRFVFREY